MNREARTEDIPFLVEALSKLVSHVQQTTNDIYFSNLEEQAPSTVESIFNDALSDYDSRILISEYEGEKAGFIFGRVSKPFLPVSGIEKIGLVEMCWVDQRHRKKGFSRRLCEDLERWFRSKKLQYADLHFLVGNTEAENSWERLGYKPYRVTSRKEL